MSTLLLNIDPMHRFYIVVAVIAGGVIVAGLAKVLSALRSVR